MIRSNLTGQSGKPGSKQFKDNTMQMNKINTGRLRTMVYDMPNHALYR
jgi:hypothetical protein